MDDRLGNRPIRSLREIPSLYSLGPGPARR